MHLEMFFFMKEAFFFALEEETLGDQTFSLQTKK